MAERRTGVWHRRALNRYELTEPSGELLGTYVAQLPDITTARATIGATTLTLEGSGTIRRELCARDDDEQVLARVTASTITWHGTAHLGDLLELDLHRAPALNLKWLVGPRARPLLVTEVRRKKIHIDIDAELLRNHPALVATAMFLLHHHRTGSMAG